MYCEEFNKVNSTHLLSEESSVKRQKSKPKLSKVINGSYIFTWQKTHGMPLTQLNITWNASSDLPHLPKNIFNWLIY